MLPKRLDKAMSPQTTPKSVNPITRIRTWYAFLLILCAVFVIRLFYLQVIRHEHYQTAALAGQLKSYEIPASRGVIEAHNGDETVPIVLNETVYTLFADPVYVKDPTHTADKLARVVGGSADHYEKLLKMQDTRYVVLAKRLSKETSNRIQSLELKGVGTRATPQRTYPQGSLAAQALGFVNDEGKGTYGIEQALNKVLSGTPGQLKAITDAQGVPLAANKDNVMIEPRNGKRTTLTIDISMQEQLEDILKAGLDRAKSDSGSALIIEAKTGAVKAMANYPTYNPAEFYKVENGELFTNAVVSSPLEIGSTMKPLTAAAALDLGVVGPDTTYYDPSHYQVDDAVVKNIEEDGGPGVRSVRDILQLSLNTGATWLLMQMGGGQINRQARDRWHDYMVNHYQFGKPTNIEQGYESAGTVPDPDEGYGLNIRYANTVFGQGLTITPLQLAAALASTVNGGTYYQPHLVETSQPKVVRKDVVNPAVSRTMQSMMEYVFDKNQRLYGATRQYPAYSIGGKTGTAQVARPEGGYYDNLFNGTFMGFVGGNEPEYVIVVRVNRPKIAGYAGSQAAAPLFVNLATMLLDNFGVTPRQ